MLIHCGALKNGANAIDTMSKIHFNLYVCTSCLHIMLGHALLWNAWVLMQQCASVMQCSPGCGYVTWGREGGGEGGEGREGRGGEGGFGHFLVLLDNFN